MGGDYTHTHSRSVRYRSVFCIAFSHVTVRHTHWHMHSRTASRMHRIVINRNCPTDTSYPNWCWCWCNRSRAIALRQLRDAFTIYTLDTTGVSRTRALSPPAFMRAFSSTIITHTRAHTQWEYQTNFDKSLVDPVPSVADEQVRMCAFGFSGSCLLNTYAIVGCCCRCGRAWCWTTHVIRVARVLFSCLLFGCFDQTIQLGTYLLQHFCCARNRVWNWTLQFWFLIMSITSSFRSFDNTNEEINIVKCYTGLQNGAEWRIAFYHFSISI